MEKDYEKMWNKLKRNIASDINMFSSENIQLVYGDIIKVATAKIVQQTMDMIEKETDPYKINT